MKRWWRTNNHSINNFYKKFLHLAKSFIIIVFPLVVMLKSTEDIIVWHSQLLIYQGTNYRSLVTQCCIFCYLDKDYISVNINLSVFHHNAVKNKNQKKKSFSLNMWQRILNRIKKNQISTFDIWETAETQSSTYQKFVIYKPSIGFISPIVHINFRFRLSMYSTFFFFLSSLAKNPNFESLR